MNWHVDEAAPDSPFSEAAAQALWLLHLTEILGCSMEWAEDILTRWYLPDSEGGDVLEEEEWAF